MDDELADLFLRAARRMRGRQVEHLAPLGLTPAQARALRVIVRADAPPRMAELATLLGVVPRSVTTLVDALEEAGLVTRTPDPANRRSTLVVPTAEGRAIRARMASVRREVAEEVLAPLSMRPARDAPRTARRHRHRRPVRPVPAPPGAPRTGGPPLTVAGCGCVPDP